MPATCLTLRQPASSRLICLGLPAAVLLVALLLFCPGTAHADTPVSGWIPSGTWTTAGSPYIVESDVSVGGDKALVIDPGVQVRFKKDTSLIIYGSLEANGTGGARVVFTSNEAAPAAGDWIKIQFVDASHGRLSNCEVKYGGRSNGPVLTVQAADVQITDCNIHDNQSPGVSVEKADISPLLQNLTLTNNAGPALQQWPNTSPIYRNLTATGNHPDGIALVWGWVNSATTWDGSQANLPFVNMNGVSIGGPGNLTITAGTTVRHVRGMYLAVEGGRLTANGTSDKPIVFTSNETPPAPGDWINIQFKEGSYGRLSHCEVKYGGRSNGPVLTVLAADVQITDCNIHDNQSPGVSIERNDSSPLLQNLTITNNAGPAVQQVPQTSPIYRNLTASGNHPDGIAILWGWVNSATTWDGSQANLPFVNMSGVSIGGPGVLTVAAGTTVRNASDMYLSVQGGRLIANGVPDKPVVFTGSTLQAGDWKQIDFTAGSRGEMSNCEIGYAGGVSGVPALVIRSSDVSVRNCRVHHGSGHGISIEGANLTPTLEDVAFDNNAGAAIYQQASNSPVYRRLNAIGNGKNAIVTGGWLDYSMAWDGATAGLPWRLDSTTYVRQGLFLALTPGTKVLMEPQASLSVSGQLYAIGDTAHPVAIVGVTPSAGSWGTIDVQPTGRVFFQNCDVGYGGNGGYPMILLRSASSISNCRVHHSGGPGIVVTDNQRPYLAYNSIDNNAMGVRNDTPATTVLARDNWWGHASGPYHATLNSSGQGNPVSNGVDFIPWLTAPAAGSPGAGIDVIVSLGSPRRVSPGGTGDYTVFYLNNTAATVNDAVLVLILPELGQLADATNGGIYWAERNQTFWRLGDLHPGESGIVTARVRFPWGLPQGTQQSAMAVMVGSNRTIGPILAAPYLAYAPKTVLSRTSLTPAEVQAERSASAGLDKIYSQALKDGMIQASAEIVNYAQDGQVTEIGFVAPAAGRLLQIKRQGINVEGTTFMDDGYAVRDPTGGMTVTLSTGATQTWGTWNEQMALSFSPNVISYERCVRNCVLRKVPGWIASRLDPMIALLKGAYYCDQCVRNPSPDVCAKCYNTIVAQFPFYGETVDVAQCMAGCVFSDQRDKYACTAGETTTKCGASGLSGFFLTHTGQHPYTSWTCMSTGFWTPGQAKTCGFLSPCVDTPDANGNMTAFCGGSFGCGKTTGSTSAIRFAAPQVEELASCPVSSTEVSVAKDPNAKHGPAGDVLPDKPVPYTVEWENVGEGVAYGVYVVDVLSDLFDDSTLDLQGNGTYIAASRTIMWDVGELAPKGQPGSTGQRSFTVRPRAGLPGGTALTNQAVVYFPSVPEQTPTNVVVNVVAGVTALPQQVETNAGQAKQVTLQGADPAGGALTFAVVLQPAFGVLSGAPPSVTYTPMAGFNGQDRFTYTASKTGETSRPAEVAITVKPSAAADHTPPQVTLVTPADGAVGIAAGPDVLYTDAQGAAYNPALSITFDEQIDPVSLASGLQLRAPNGSVIALAVTWDGSARKAHAAPRLPLAGKSTYTARATTAIKDTAGNSLASDYIWTFMTAEQGSAVYLPMLRRAGP